MPVVLPEARPDFAAKQKGLLDIIAQNAGIDSASLAGFNPDYLQNVNNLYQQYAADMLGLNQETTNADVEYGRNFPALQARHAQATQALRDKMAFRGLRNSSIAGDEELRLMGAQTEEADALKNAYTRAIGDIGERRNLSQGAYSTGMGTQEDALTQAAGAWLKDKQAADEDRRIRELAANNAGTVNTTQTGINNALTGAVAGYNAQPIDFSKYAGLFVQNTPQAMPAPPMPAPRPAYNAQLLSDPLGINTAKKMAPASVPKPASLQKVTTKKPVTRYSSIRS